MFTKEQVEKLNLAAPETIDYLVRTLGSEGEYVHIWGSFGFLCEATLELHDKLEKAEVELKETHDLLVAADMQAEKAVVIMKEWERIAQRAEAKLAELREAVANGGKE